MIYKHKQKIFSIFLIIIGFMVFGCSHDKQQILSSNNSVGKK